MHVTLSREPRYIVIIYMSSIDGYFKDEPIRGTLEIEEARRYHAQSNKKRLDYFVQAKA